MKERITIQKAKDHVSLEEYIRDQFKTAKTGRIDVQYTPVVTRIIIHTVTPGLVVGSGGERIRQIVEDLKKMFSIKNPQIDVQRIQNQFMDPFIVAQNIAKSLENGTNFKRLGEYYLTRIMSSGAIGCELVLAGKISGQRARTERFSAGYLKKAGFTAEEDVIKGFAVAMPKLGAIGVTVKIMIRQRDTLKKIIGKKEQKATPMEVKEISEAAADNKESEDTAADNAADNKETVQVE